MEAFNVLGVTRLSGRIHDLRQKGYDIESETIESENRYGDKVRYYKYFLKKDKKYWYLWNSWYNISAKVQGGKNMTKKEKNTTKKYPAKFIKVLKNTNPFDKHAWEHTDILYEYKGHQYIVTKDNNGCMDTPLYIQHKIEQEKIDETIKEKSKPKKIKEWKYEGSAQEGFDIFWEYVNREWGDNTSTPTL